MYRKHTEVLTALIKKKNLMTVPKWAPFSVEVHSDYQTMEDV
jgi:hypothetical protein